MPPADDAVVGAADLGQPLCAGLGLAPVGAQTVAALAAVNFFIFSPRVPTPAVTRAIVIDDSTVQLEYQGSLPPVVARMESDYSRAAALSARGTYDAGATLVKDCVVYQRDIELLMPKA